MSWIGIDLNQFTQGAEAIRNAGVVLRSEIQAYLAKDGARLIQRKAVEYVSGVPIPGVTAAPPTIFKRSGNLSRGIEVESPYAGIPMSLRVFADARERGGANYADVLHEGRTIVPKRARALVFRIPIEGARGTGGARATYGLKKVASYARRAAYRANLDDTNSMLVICSRVTIPPRPFIRAAVQQSLPQIVKDIQGILDRHFRAGGGA